MRATFFSRFTRSKLFLICAIVVLILVGVSLGREFSKSRGIENQIKTLEAEAKRLEGRNNELLGISAKLKDPDFVEREARTRFGLQKPGESVIVVRVPSPTDASAPPSIAVSNLKAWWLYFFNHEEFEKLS